MTSASYTFRRAVVRQQVCSHGKKAILRRCRHESLLQHVGPYNCVGVQVVSGHERGQSPQDLYTNPVSMGLVKVQLVLYTDFGQTTYLT